MNNDKKIPDASEEIGEQYTPQTSEPKQSGNWWTRLSRGVRIGIIAGISCLAIGIAVLAIVLLGGSGNGPDGPDGPGGQGGGSGKVYTYNITVVTKGGMALSKLPIYIFELEDGALGDMVEDGGYAATDENGKATFNLPDGKEYAVRINTSTLTGYDLQPYYPIVSSDMTITLSSEVIPETSLVGVSYGLGSVMHDFTVTTTEGTTFTLSEVLKEKKAVLINFWYTECTWCITEFPLMQEAYEKYKDDLAIIALDPPTANNDNITDVKAFKSAYGLTFDVAMEELGLASTFGVEGYPTSVIVDRYGVVAMIEAGAITSERAFDVIFDHFTADNYEQKLIVDYSDIVPREKPEIEMPDNDEFASFFEGADLGDVTYRNDEEDEYSWPFITGNIGEGDDAVKVVYPSNANKESSYAQLLFDVDLNAGDVLAFDYFSSTELGADILYVIVNGKDIYSISGESNDWSTCYAYVAQETGIYEVGLVYIKDSSDNAGSDTVYLKNLRIVSESDIDSATYIYRFAATNPDKYNNYQDFVTPVLGADGYYHVSSVKGPIILMDLMC